MRSLARRALSRACGARAGVSRRAVLCRAGSGRSLHGAGTTSDGVVRLDYDALEAGADLGPAIEQAYGPDGVGLLVVRGVPNFVEYRRALLPLASKLASLPSAALAKLEHEESKWSVGWSHGKEEIEPGKPGERLGRGGILSSTLCGMAGGHCMLPHCLTGPVFIALPLPCSTPTQPVCVCMQT